MSNEQTLSDVEQVSQRDTQTRAVRLVMEGRALHGNGSAYDRFLCDFIGVPGGPACPVAVRGVSGRTYSYNNPHTIHRWYTEHGMLLDVRRVERSRLSNGLSPEDRLSAFFVAWADLETGTATQLRVLDITEGGLYGGQPVTWLLVSDKPALIGGQSADAERPTATIELSSQGCSLLIGGSRDPLLDVIELVKAVNEQTAQCGLDLDELREESIAPLARLAIAS
jgi:hypothetical protein